MHNCGREMAARASGAAAVRGDGAKDQGRRRIGGPRDGGWRTLTQKLRAKMGRPESKESARRFSIIITCYNQREYIGEAVQSAISQGGRLKEVIVVGDASSDGSPVVLGQYAKAIQVIGFPRNRGARKPVEPPENNLRLPR